MLIMTKRCIVVAIERRIVAMIERCTLAVVAVRSMLIDRFLQMLINSMLLAHSFQMPIAFVAHAMPTQIVQIIFAISQLASRRLGGVNVATNGGALKRWSAGVAVINEDTAMMPRQMRTAD